MSDEETGYRRESHHSPRDRDRRSRDHDRDRRDRDRSAYDDRRSRDRTGEDRDRYNKRDRHYNDRQEDNDSLKDVAEVADNSYAADDSYYRRPRFATNNTNSGKGRWNDSIPNNIILVRGLPDEADENDIINEFARAGVTVKDVRLMRGKDTGLSRRYCFVEFHTVAESQYWMEVHQGMMKLQDKFTLNMYYSTSRRGNINTITVPDASMVDSSMDWICAKCSCKNFQRRSHCRRCNNSREESERVTSGDGLDQVGCNPCNTLILRGLDGLTTEETIITALSNVTSLPLKNVRVMRDFMTGASNGFAFVEMNSLKESKELLEYLESLENPLEVDGKALLIAYAKNTFSTALATMEMQQHNQTTQYMQQQATVAAGGVGVAVGSYLPQHPDYSQHGYYDVNAYYYQATALPDPSSATQMDSTNAAAAVAQAAIMQSQQKKQSSSSASTAAVVAAPPVLNRPTPMGTTMSPLASTASLQDYPKYPVPDVSTYQYEETSGYYYDPSTSLYYDASTQYYYNSQAQQWLYWDGEHQTYLPAPSTDTTSSSGGSGGVQQQQQQEDQQRRDEDDEKRKRQASPEKKVKIAKRIVKDMEKWAKRLNAQKDAMKDDMKKMMQTTTTMTMTQASGEPVSSLQPLHHHVESASADAGFSLLEKSVYSKSLPEPGRLREMQQSPAVTAPSSIPSPLHTKVELPGPSSLSMAEAPKSMFASEEEMTDWKKMACLLCRRAFPSKDVLIKHQQMSDLHKKNLEELYRSRGHCTDESLVQQYRDRAKERREKYGLPEPPQPKKRAREETETVIPFEQPTQEGIKEDNIGNKLLQKMGWKDGQGLGRANQGIVDPIEARQRQAQAGLGARGSAYNVDTTSGSYKERARKTFMAYFHEIN